MLSTVLSLSHLDQQCVDPRMPYVRGQEIVFCDEKGLSTQIFDLTSGETHHFEHAILWFDSKYVWFAGVEGGLVDRERHNPSHRPKYRVVSEPQGGPVFWKDESLVVVDGEVVWTKGNVGQKNKEAHPKSWEHPHLNQCGAFWIDKDDQIVWWKRDGAIQRSDPKDHPRSLVGGNEWVAWAEDDEVWLWNCQDGSQTSWQGRAIDRVTFNQGVLCWSFWNGTDADIRCTNDFVLNLEGDQVWPSLGDGWLIFRDQQGVRGVEWSK